MYDDFARVLRKDVLNCHKDKVILDQTYAITKRVGLAQVIRAICSVYSITMYDTLIVLFSAASYHIHIRCNILWNI